MNRLESASERTLQALWEGSWPMSLEILDALPVHLTSWIMPSEKYCQLRFSLPSVSGGYSKVRVAGFAAALGIFKGRVTSGGGPC